jgi:hypothetical protein
MSLKSTLHEEIRKTGYMPIERVYDICAELHYKTSNAERRLRQSESPMIAPVMSENGKYIKGYKWLGLPEIKKEPVQTSLLKLNI